MAEISYANSLIIVFIAKEKIKFLGIFKLFVIFKRYFSSYDLTLEKS